MLIEVPSFEKCCFCLPLRQGLAAWGIFKMVLAFALLLYIQFVMQKIVDKYAADKNSILVMDIVLLWVVAIMLMIDFLLQSFFIIGAMKNNVKHLKVYYIYSQTLLGLSILLMIPTAVLMIKNMVGEYNEQVGLLFTLKIFGIFINFLIQGYFLLLLRSNIIKLESVSFSTLENSAAEDDYTMRIEGPYEVK